MTIVMPTYGDPATTIDAVTALRAHAASQARRGSWWWTTAASREHQERLQELEGRGARAGAREPRLRRQREPRPGARRAGARRGGAQQRRDRPRAAGSRRLQHAAYARRTPASWARSCSTPTGGSSPPAPTATSARPSGSTTATASSRPTTARPTCADTALAVTGACMYLRRALIDEIGAFDEGFPMALRGRGLLPARLGGGLGGALRAGRPARPTSSRPPAAPRWASASGARRSTSGTSGATWFDGRDGADRRRRAADRLRHEDTGVGGGHRDIFEHLNRLRRAATTWSCTRSAARRTGSRSRCRCAPSRSYEELAAALAREDAIKVATWWATAPWVWRASVTRGLPGLLRPGHRDLLLPGRRPAAQNRGARQLPRGVPLHDDLGLEPRAAGASWAWRPS